MNRKMPNSSDLLNVFTSQQASHSHRKWSVKKDLLHCITTLFSDSFDKLDFHNAEFVLGVAAVLSLEKV